MSPGQQANDTHLTVWWHPNPLHYLSRGITNLLAIIQFASCKLPFHSMKEWFPICNICVKRITNVTLIFLQTIRHHKREHCVHKIAHGMGGRMIQFGGGHCHSTLLNGIDAAEGTGMFQKDNEKTWFLSHCWAESISMGFKKCSSFILCQEPSCSPPPKKE